MAVALLGTGLIGGSIGLALSNVGMTVRVLMHLYTERSRAELHHVYLGGATSLRDDLPE